MCVHREHRTGNCRVCEAEAQVVDMPQRWEGDDS